MAVKIRLKRLGKIRAPYYRIVVVDSRVKRDGRVIEEIGKYHPTEDPSFIEVKSDRVQYWLGVGAQPTEAVLAQLKLTGDWQKFKGLPYQDGALKIPARQAAEAARQAQAAVEAAEAEALKKVTAQAEAKAKADKEAAEAEAKAKAAQEAAAAEAEAPGDEAGETPSSSADEAADAADESAKADVAETVPDTAA